jgi:hypothetical protein
MNGVTNLAKGSQTLLLTSHSRRRVGEEPVQAGGHTGKDRALSLGAVTDRDENAECSRPRYSARPLERWPVMSMPRSANDPDGERVDLARFQAGAEGLVAIVAVGAQKTLGHLAAGRVVRAEKQYPGSAHLTSRRLRVASLARHG